MLRKPEILFIGLEDDFFHDLDLSLFPFLKAEIKALYSCV